MDDKQKNLVTIVSVIITVLTVMTSRIILTSEANALSDELTI
jgi:hypothetical protein